jgi:hypothetical protein
MRTSFFPQKNYNPLLIAEAASGLIKGGIGLIQRGSENRWLKNNQEPVEMMPSEIKRNQQLATIRANTGLPSEQYNNAMKNIQRQQLMTLRKAQDLGGGKALSILGGLNQQGNDAVGDLDARDAQMRVSNEGTLMNVNNNVAGWKSKLFDSNIRQRWMRQYEQKMGELGSGNTNLTNGIDGLASAGIGFAAGMNGGGQGEEGGSGGTGISTEWLMQNRPRTYTRRY